MLRLSLALDVCCSMARSMNIMMLLAMALIVSASARMLTAEQGRELAADAEEHQRILAELEQVHQLRERMLQEGTTQTHRLTPCCNHNPLHSKLCLCACGQ